MKPFLILQLRPEDEAADDEFKAFLRFGGLLTNQVQRYRIEKTGFPKINLDNYSGVMVGGGAANVSDPADKKTPEQLGFEAEMDVLLDDIIERDFPYLGTCYGQGILVRHLGGEVAKGEGITEVAGAVTIRCTPAAIEDPLLRGLPGEFRAFVGHKEGSRVVPKGAILLAGSDTCPVQMMRVKNNIYATQFHTELDTEGLELRIEVYKHFGYFPPEEAAGLRRRARQENITVPMEILAGFVRRYKT